MIDKPHILVVDDQQDIREPLCEHLRGNEFIVTGAANAEGAYKELASHSIDLVVLDIMMPGEDGLSVCRHISETSAIPVILLTALADDTDRIVGLEIGADDYVTKPFNPRELIARIRSVLRRTNKTDGAAERKGRFITFGDWRLDKSMGELYGKDETVVALSTGELRLLNIFLEHPDEVLSRDQLLTLTKGRDAFPFERSIDNMTSRLRHKIEPNPNTPIYIKTVWGGGYRFIADIGSE